MKLLLDTHTLIWLMLDNPRLSIGARRAVQEIKNEVYVSAVSIWEIAVKVRIGKLHSPAGLLADPYGSLGDLGFYDLPLQMSHARLAGSLRHTHKDPFDRMLAAQALVEGLTLVSVDAIFDELAVTRLW